MILDSLEELQKELKMMDIEITSLMNKKAVMADKKREVERRIKEMQQLREDADKKLQGYSYETVRNNAGACILLLSDILTRVDPSCNSNLFYDHFGYMIDTESITPEKIFNDYPLLNAIIEVAGGELIMTYMRGRGEQTKDTRVDAKTSNMRKRFMEKLKHPKVRRELIRYKTDHEGAKQ